MKITKEHLILLKNMNVGWQECEQGAPEIDPKRPYGNSDVEGDICELLGIQRVSVNYEEGFRTEDLEYAAKIHKEMGNVIKYIFNNYDFKKIIDTEI